MGTVRKLNMLCRILKYSLSLALLATSIYFSKDVLDQYASQATSFKEYEEEVTQNESVTVVIGLWPLKNMNYKDNRSYQSYEQWELGKDFNLTFGVINYRTIQEMILLKDDGEDLRLRHSSVGKVRFSKLVTHWGNFYKISASIINVKRPFYAFVNIQIDKSIQEENIPSSEIVFSSEANSYGITMDNWLEGNRQGFHYNQGYRFIEIQPRKVVKMVKCSTSTTFYDCFHSELTKMEFDGCTRKCFSVSTNGNAAPICETMEEFHCSHKFANQLMTNSKCLPICSQISFDKVHDYQEDLYRPDAKRNITVAFRIPKMNMKVEEEYLIQDFVGMLGSIGGTLGLFIGFSFLGGTFFILDHFQFFFERFTTKLPGQVDGIKNRNVINVLPKDDERDETLVTMDDILARMKIIEENMKPQ